VPDPRPDRFVERVVSAKDGEEDHTWPAFVDALTTMTMILTFVMLILAVGIASMAQNVSKDVVKAIAEAVNKNAPPGQPQVTTSEEIVAAIERLHRPAPIQSSPVEIERRIENREPVERAPDAREVRATRSQAALTLTYPARQSRLDEASRTELKGFLAESQEVRSARQIEIRAIASPTSGALTEARRVAYYRAMLVRGELLANGVTPDRIAVRVDERATTEDAETVRVFARP
jgi:hypothetical protein